MQKYKGHNLMQTHTNSFKTGSIDLPKPVLSAGQHWFYRPAKPGSINLTKLVLSTCQNRFYQPAKLVLPT
jgi:hypothetical protein